MIKETITKILNMKTEQQIKQHVGAIIKEARIKKDYNQEDLAAMIGLTRVSILNIESGRHNPPLYKFYLLCCILDLNPENVFPKVEPIEIKFKTKTVIIKKKKIIYQKIKS